MKIKRPAPAGFHSVIDSTIGHVYSRPNEGDDVLYLRINAARPSSIASGHRPFIELDTCNIAWLSGNNLTLVSKSPTVDLTS